MKTLTSFRYLQISWNACYMHSTLTIKQKKTLPHDKVFFISKFSVEQI